MAKYTIHAVYNDPEIKIKNAKNEPQDIVLAQANYRLDIIADDMKKAYDIAMQYMPVGTNIYNIEKESTICDRF